MNAHAMLCRCCLSQPLDKDLWSLHVLAGGESKTEVYGDLLEECFDIKLSFEEEDTDNGICNVCIARLRDARDFKHQVLHCQEEFKLKQLDRNYYNLKSPISELREDDDLGSPISQESANVEDSDSYSILEPKKEILELDLEEDHLTDIFEINNVDTKMSNRYNIVSKKCEINTAKKQKVVDKKNGQEFASTFTMTANEDGTRSYTCKICHNVYGKRNNMYQHYKHVHLKQRPKLRGCHLCNVKVPGYMRSFHMEEHGLPAPSCNACGKKFAYPFQVLRHQRFYHMGEARFSCKPCNLKFISQSRYKHHLIKHRDEKAFKCELCDKTFKWKSGLQTHMLIHNNIRRHICHICQAAFVQQASLTYHLTKKHPEVEYLI